MNEKGSRWHLTDALSLCQHLHTNAACGLSRKAARSRLKREGRNPLFDEIVQKKKGFIGSLFLDPAILLMLLGVLLAIAFLSPLQIICTVVVLLLLLAVLLRFLYRSAELSRITSQYRTPTVRVLRDSRILTVSAAHVVVGDILLLREGDIVPGDCRLLTSNELRVLTLLPNEKGNPTYKEYTKNAAATYPYGTHVDAPLAENMLYGGSEILFGDAKAVLVAKGEKSYLGAMRSFTLPAEIKEKRGETPVKRMLNPYLRAWGLLSLILLALLTLIGLITKPTGGELTEYFFILCILTASSAPALLSLYLQWISIRGRLLCMENVPHKNRAVVKSEAGMTKLSAMTDLFVIGKRGICDGVTHFWSAFVGEREIRADDENEKINLHSVCEAMLLRREADLRMPASGYGASSEAQGAYLSELVSLCGFDAGALKVRLKSIERAAYPGRASWQCVTAHLQEGDLRLIFDNSGTLMRHCLVYADGTKTKAITPEHRSTLRKYCEYIEENGCRALCIARVSGADTLALVGILALREQVSAVLPSVVEELAQSGVTTRFFLRDDDYARACRLPEPYLYRNEEHPALTLTLLQSYRTFIGFSKEELSALLPIYQKSGHRIAVLGGNADDRCFLRGGVLTLACDTVSDLSRYAENHIEEATGEDGSEGSHNASQTMRRHADVVIERADRFFGGVYAALQALSHSRAVGARSAILLQFWLHSQLARILMTVFAVCTGIGLFSILQMFLCDFVLEVAAVFWLSQMPISQPALRNPQTLNNSFINNKLFSKEKLLSTLISVGITALLAIILALVGVFSRSVTQTYLFFSLLLLQLSILGRICFAEKARPQPKRALIFGGILVGAIALFTLLSVLIAPFGVVTGMGALTPLSAILLPLCPALYFVLNLLLPFLHRTAK